MSKRLKILIILLAVATFTIFSKVAGEVTNENDNER